MYKMLKWDDGPNTCYVRKSKVRNTRESMAEKYFRDSAMNKGQKKIKVRLEGTQVNKMKRRKID